MDIYAVPWPSSETDIKGCRTAAEKATVLYCVLCVRELAEERERERERERAEERKTECVCVKKIQS